VETARRARQERDQMRELWTVVDFLHQCD
jgi:hypothetical protein